MKYIQHEVENQQVTTRTWYTTDCFRMILDKESGEKMVKRWVEKRMVCVNLQIVRSLGAIFHNGARIA